MDDNLTDFAPAEQLEQPQLKVDHGDGDPEETAASSSGPDSANTCAEAEDPLIGQIVAQTFDLQRCLGRGGMGVVYQARHVILNKPVALKLLNQLKARDPEVVARFRREAVAISSLDHPNIVRLNAFGVDEQDRAYLVMDLVEGKPLSDLIKERGRLAPKQALEITSQILAALNHAHAKHMIHRDIKPGNIMVVEQSDGSLLVKVVDFGLAKIVGSSEGMSQSLSLTKTGEMLGSPHYMSPEQCTGEPLDERSDIYSTGCVLYEMLSGRPPFDADNMLKVLHLHATGRHKALTDLKVSAELSQAINGLVDTAMAKDLADRYHSTSAMLKSVQSILLGHWSWEGHTDLQTPKADTSDVKVRSFIEQWHGDRLETRNLIVACTAMLLTTVLALEGFFRIAPEKKTTSPAISAFFPRPVAPIEKSTDEYARTTLDLENLSILDPTTGRTINFTERLDSRQQKPDLLAEGKVSSPYTRDASTIDGGIPALIPSYQKFKQQMQKYADLKGRSYADLDHIPVLQIADYCFECGDMGRALCLYQKLLSYGHLDGSEKAAIRGKEGDCYMYFNDFDAAAQSYLTALGYQRESDTIQDKEQTSVLELRLAYCYRAAPQSSAVDYAQKSFDTMSQLEPLAPDSSLRKNPEHQAVLGDANLMLGKPSEALLNFQSARSEVMSFTDPTVKDIRRRYAAQLDLRIAKACLALDSPDQALKAMRMAKGYIESTAETPAPANEPTVPGELYPRIYYTMGLAYEQKYRHSSKADTKSLHLALENFYQALRAGMAANTNGQNTPFAEMCLAKLSMLSPDFIVTYTDGRHRAADAYTRVSALNLPRPVLPPPVLPE
jgi:serine/threonine protein kinase